MMDFKHLLNFLSQLAKNNNKEWFDAHKKEYETLRKEWITFVGDAIQTVGSFDSGILSLEPKKCIFRINRDIRFSNDKSPYKNNFGMSLNPAGKGSDFCGYYLHIQPGNCFIAGGAYMPSPDRLAAIRQEIDYNFVGFQKIVSAKSFINNFGTLSGEKLVRPPKGYESDNPAIDYLKHKGFIAQRSITDKELCGPELMTLFSKTTLAIKPLVDFLNQAQTS
jgi:uncharacterized protein (TIGR02453 family)